MVNVAILIDALVDEDTRLRELAAAFPPEHRESTAPGFRMGLKATLAHLASWDDFTTTFFDAVCGGEGVVPPSFEAFVAGSHERELEICRAPFETVLDLYRRATGNLLGLLSRHWSDLDDTQRRNLFLPLRHRRHHRRQLAAVLEQVAPQADAEEGLAGAAG